MRGTAIIPLLMGWAVVAALPEVTEAKGVRFVVEQRAPFAPRVIASRHSAA